ncbi:MAG: hypothetical protein CSA29_03595 [Desulfobacterales bacterium]|nr:MAG: hypothetical protein CSA29_03595 [Desulfobacterales bacterium]
MTGRGSILLFWVLLMVPTVILLGVAFKLLSHEDARLRQANIDTMMNQARTIASKIDLTIETVQNNLAQSLLGLWTPDQWRSTSDVLQHRLLNWERKNPLVRNVFIYHPKKGLLYPECSLAATREERQFIHRFSPLFSGTLDFELKTSQKETRQVSPKAMPRAELYKLSQAPSRAATVSDWMPWFSENQLYILGWVKPGRDGLVYGIELEVMTLLSRLATEFFTLAQRPTAYVLANGSGTVLLQSGDVIEGHPPLGKIEVSPRLPHWRLCVYAGTVAENDAKGFMALALMALSLLLISIITGGILITRLTLSKIKDARQKTSFVASVSHELKTPLTSIRMYAELLQSQRVRDPDKQAQYLNVIVGESGRLTRLINNVLDFGRLEQGRKIYRPERFDLKACLDTLISAHAIRLQKAGFKIMKVFPPTPVDIETDRDALEQAVLNIIDNALKYADSGQFIQFTLNQEADDIILEIQDDGPGIPDSAHGLIFDKFYRADTSLTASKPGSGLGLSIARQMLRDLGGDLYIMRSDIQQPGTPSKRNTGANFIIRMPCNVPH